jgi:hypothetical protein
MASRGQALTLAVYAYDTAAPGPKTGDAANLTLRLVKDGGTPAAPTNAAAEIDATNLPGWYQVALTAGECTCHSLVLGGKSSTSGVVVTGTQVTFEQTAAETAAAWGASVVGNGRTRDYYLQGGTNLIAFAADGLSWTLYAADDATPLQAGTATRLAASVGGLRGVDPT